MLYKYLNPNLIAVGTEVTPDTKPGISIYLIDAVTGTNVVIIICYFLKTFCLLRVTKCKRDMFSFSSTCQTENGELFWNCVVHQWKYMYLTCLTSLFSTCTCMSDSCSCNLP